MRCFNSARTLLVAALLLAAAPAGPAQARPTAPPRTAGADAAADTAADAAAAAALASLSFLAGHWRGPFGPDSANIIFDATYTTSEGIVLSASRMLQGGTVTRFEFERFAIVDDALTLTPYPGGKETVSFKYVPSESSAAQAVFTNPRHDYPTQLVYALVEPDHLTITLSAPAAKDPQTMVFDLWRAP